MKYDEPALETHLDRIIEKIDAALEKLSELARYSDPDPEPFSSKA